MLTHEELQATIEEFETTNEELQATNEELETNNEELQATNEELETTNEELRARTGELQEIGTMLESERVRLAEMVELAPFYIMVLRGPELIVEAYNPRYAELLQEQLAPGKTLENVFAHAEEGQVVIETAREVYTRDIVLSTPRTFPSSSEMSETHNAHIGQNFVHTIVPSHNAFGKVIGVIIYSIDETERTEIEEESRKLKLIFDHADITALALFDAQTAQTNHRQPTLPGYRRQYPPLGPQPLIGCKWQELTMFMQDTGQPSLWDTVLATGEAQRLPELHVRLTPDTPGEYLGLDAHAYSFGQPGRGTLCSRLGGRGKSPNRSVIFARKWSN